MHLRVMAIKNENNGHELDKIKWWTLVMGARLSKFSLTGHIQSFHGELIEDRSGEDSDHLSQEGTTFYSDFYVYRDIVNVNTDSD